MSAPERHVVITGANRGLGLELARQCAARGDHVWGGCRSPESADALRALDRVNALRLDVADGSSIAAFAEGVSRRIDHVDLLINNAGANAAAFGGDRSHSGVLELHPGLFRAQMEVNAIGPMMLTRALVPMLRAAPRAVIVNVSSQLGSLALGARMRGDIGYNASKAALNMITVALAGELGPEGFVAVAVHPGWVRTDMGGHEAPLTAEASAAAILETVSSLTTADNGRFLTWTGEPHPW